MCGTFSYSKLDLFNHQLHKHGLSVCQLVPLLHARLKHLQKMAKTGCRKTNSEAFMSPKDEDFIHGQILTKPLT